MTIRVVVCEDEALMRAGLILILQTEPDVVVVGEAWDGESAVAEARRTHPDVVLMDLRMPGMDGVAATRALAGPGVADPVSVLILSTYDLDRDVYRALRAGASGYLLKGGPPEEMIRGIRAVVNGDAVLAPSVTRQLLRTFVSIPPDRVDPAASDDKHDAARAAVAGLTPREREVLELLGRGHSNQEVADLLVLSLDTVRTHVKRILGKLCVHDRMQAVVIAHRAGLVP